MKQIWIHGNHFVLSNLKKILREHLDTDLDTVHRVLQNRHEHYLSFELDL